VAVVATAIIGLMAAFAGACGGMKAAEDARPASQGGVANPDVVVIGNPGDVPEWMQHLNQPAEPFRIAGDVYFVGTSGVGVFLIPTPEGHILIDSGFEASVPMIADSVRQLGFRFQDIKVVLTSHAHSDHAGGHAWVRRVTGARVLASEADVQMLAAGGRGDFAYGDSLPFPPVDVDGIVADGEGVQLGGVTLTAHQTAGHTKGAITWTTTMEEGGQPLEVVFFSSAGLHPAVPLRNNPSYPTIIQDYEQSFALWKQLPCDLFLGSHTVFFDLPAKRARQKLAPTPNPFIDPDGFRALIAQQEARFRDRLAAEPGP
jgi:metallo-beta-lactamase class B